MVIFSLLRGPGAASAASRFEPTYFTTEEYVSRLRNLHLPVFSNIYRAGHPSPIALDHFDRVAQQRPRP